MRSFASAAGGGVLNRLRERRLAQWALGYVAGAWGLLQAIDLLGSHFGWPPMLFRFATVALATGLGLLVVLAWFHAERGRQRVGPLEALLLTLLLALGGVAAWLLPPPAAAGKQGSAGGGPPASRSLAVLPFVNLSGARADEYYSDGITEEILDAVSRIPSLAVAARTSSFAFRGRNGDVATIARQLRVRHVLEGSVQRQGGRVRITAELVDAASGYRLWSERYDRDARDLFAVEDDISRAIARQLAARLSAGQVLAEAATQSLSAHDFYLLALNYWSRRTAQSLRRAQDFFARAVAADPRYARAHAGLALAWAVLPEYDRSVRFTDAFTHARVAARRALALEPASAEAHAALSQVAEYEGDLVGAEREARAAVRLNPNYATARQWLAEVLQSQGRAGEALAEVDRALALDPLSPIIAMARAAILMDTNPAAGLQALRQVVAADPELLFARTNLAVFAVEAHQDAIARQALRGTLPAFGLPAAIADSLIDGFTSAGARAAQLRALASPAVRRALDPYQLAIYYEMLGARDSALAIARATASDPQTRMNLRFNLPARPLAGLRTDPRLPPEYRIAASPDAPS